MTTVNWERVAQMRNGVIKELRAQVAAYEDFIKDQDRRLDACTCQHPDKAK